MRAAGGFPLSAKGKDRTAPPPTSNDTREATASERVPTPEQAAAIAVSKPDVLVEAGAGTGKTGVMVERYCRLVCEEGVSADAILAFTFTDKAASELRQRVRAELARHAEAGSEAARSTLGAIAGAWVTTIHGFCNRVLASHPVAAGIDPRFRVLDGPEAERAAAEAFEEALEEFLTVGGEAHEETVAAYEIEGLRALVIGAHAELRSRGLAEPGLPEPPVSDTAGAIRRAAEAALEALAALRPTDPKRDRLEKALRALDPQAQPPPHLDQLTALRTDSTARAIAGYREAIEGAIRCSAEAGEGGVTYGHLVRLLALFSARFEAAKERRSGVDFEDLQILATTLLEQSEIGDSYRSRFSHLMVDEFQDTNRLQLRLIEALRGPGSELMMVGDELQSIFGFRHADLEVFRERRRAIDDRAAAVAIELSGNFRSRPEVIGAINALGSVLLGDSFRPLRVGTLPPNDAPPGEGPAVEVLLSARDGWDAEGVDLAPAIDGRTPLSCLAEARFLAARLAELVDGGLAREEVVVLLRAFTHLDAYEDSLERAGLRPYVVGGRGYWSQQQVTDVCALLSTIANPLDDQSLFGTLASPACGVAPDTLWLLRAAAGQRRHVWLAVQRATGIGKAELADPERLEQLPAAELALLRRFVHRLEGLRGRAPRLPLANLIEAAVSETGYDLAVLMGVAGEARFANVRKLIRLGAEYESREGRDLRGLLDYLGARAESGAEAQAATATEGHDGVRIMTIHNAKGLEFTAVAVADLSRSLLAGTRAPLLTIGREQREPRIGMQLRRLGAAPINLYSYAELCEEGRTRDAEEALRLFHVAATRARERLILSGVIKPEAGGELKPATPVIERIAAGLSLERGADSRVVVPPPQPREGLDASFQPSEIAVMVNIASPERAAELAAGRPQLDCAPALGSGPAPLLKRSPPTVASRPLSYTAISAYGECAYRFYLERVLGLASNGRRSEEESGGTASAREERAARGSVVHALLEWSQANCWREPALELARRHSLAAGLDPDAEGLDESLLEPLRGWLDSSLFRERVRPLSRGVRAEAPILLGIGGTVLRGSIDLLVTDKVRPPLVLDYKTDRLGGASPAKHAARYQIQRAIYALAVAESCGASSVEVAYVFLERPDEPVLSRLERAEIELGREQISTAIERIGRGEFPAAAPPRRSWALCRSCPALGRMCSGPRD
jgi:ATP-dependent helicase/nuclease subunit A